MQLNHALLKSVGDWNKMEKELHNIITAACHKKLIIWNAKKKKEDTSNRDDSIYKNDIKDCSLLCCQDWRNATEEYVPVKKPLGLVLKV